MTKLPFLTVNRPQRGGAHDAEALVLDVIDKLYEENRTGFRLKCLEAAGIDKTLEELMAVQVHAALGSLGGMSIARKKLTEIMLAKSCDALLVDQEPPAYVALDLS